MKTVSTDSGIGLQNLVSTFGANTTQSAEDSRFAFAACFLTIVWLCVSIYLFVALGIQVVRTVHECKLVGNCLVLFSALNCVIITLNQTLKQFVVRFCTIYRWINGISLTIGLTVVYTIIWIRQRQFYQNPFMKNGVKRGIKLLSGGIIICI